MLVNKKVISFTINVAKDPYRSTISGSCLNPNPSLPVIFYIEYEEYFMVGLL
jgi:hypothetical protein